MVCERLAAALLATAAIAFAPPAQADAVKVAIVHGNEAIPLARRVQAELMALGIEVVDLPTPTDALIDDLELETAARLAGATAAIRIAAPSASVWIARSDGKQYVIRVVPTDHAASSSPDAVLVLRAVELVRVALLDPPPAPVTTPPAAAPRNALAAATIAAPRSIEAVPSRFAIELAPAIAVSPGGVPASATLLVGARWMRGSLGPSAFVTIPIFASRVDGVQGVADVRSAMLGAGLRFAPREREAIVSPSVEAGFSGAWLLIHGTGASGYSGRSDNLLVAAPYARAGLSLRISAQVALQADLLGSFALSRTSITFAGRPAASWGWPALLGSSGVELSLP